MAGDGMSIPDKAMIEHNMQSISKLYENIYIDNLCDILQLDILQVEKVI
jgi:hypothetical protein